VLVRTWGWRHVLSDRLMCAFHLSVEPQSESGGGEGGAEVTAALGDGSTCWVDIVIPPAHVDQVLELRKPLIGCPQWNRIIAPYLSLHKGGFNEALPKPDKPLSWHPAIPRQPTLSG
jgi:hypothetical protein